MKNLYFLSNKLKFKFVALALFSTVAILSCKDEEVNPYEDVTIQFKVESTTGVVLKSVVTQVGVNQSQEFILPSENYSTVPQIINTNVGALHLASTAKGFDIDSELIVKILVNGQIKATDTVSGSGNLTAKTQLSFIK